jgi:integrase
MAVSETKRSRKRKGRRVFGATRRLPSGRWQASYLDPSGVRRVAPQTFAEAADANAWLSAVERSMSAGDWRPPELARETFGDYSRRQLAHRPDLRPTTQELYAILWRRWIEPSFGDIALGAMTPEAWRTWYVEKTAAHPGSTQPGKAYRLARAILNQAVDDGLLKSNPCRVKGAGREQAPERPIVMPDQVARLADAIDPRWRAMVLLAAYCSLRFGELAGLRRSRVDTLHRTVTIEEQAIELSGGRVEFGPPKTAAGRRVVAIPGELAAILEAHLAEHVGTELGALVFTSPEGHPMRRTKFRLSWAQACASVGVSGLHFHDLRGSGATWAATGGATVRELMGRLGHTTPNVALRYQHATAERDRAIAERLDVLMRAAQTAVPEPIANVVSIER